MHRQITLRFLIHGTNYFEIIEEISKWQVRDKHLTL